jgi:hypothetical protein
LKEFLLNLKILLLIFDLSLKKVVKSDQRTSYKFTQTVWQKLSLFLRSIDSQIFLRFFSFLAGKQNSRSHHELDEEFSLEENYQKFQQKLFPHGEKQKNIVQE